MGILFRFRKSYSRHRSGFTLGEILIAVTIIALLVILMMVNYQKQVARANDVRRKSDLGRLKVAFEDYYNDHGCYPSEEAWYTTYSCDGKELNPYIEKFPCDPISGKHYIYMNVTPYVEGRRLPNCASTYWSYAALQDTSDGDISKLGCVGGCGYSMPTTYNYGISAGGAIADPAKPTPTPTPIPGSITPTLNPTLYTGTIACMTYNDCGEKSNQQKAEADGCSKTFATDAACHAAGCGSIPPPSFICTK